MHVNPGKVPFDGFAILFKIISVHCVGHGTLGATSDLKPSSTFVLQETWIKESATDSRQCKMYITKLFQPWNILCHEILISS